MDTAVLAVSPFITLLAWSVVLLVVHIGLQSIPATLELGSAWNAGARDDGQKPAGVFAGRAERAFANFRETYPAFVGLAVSLAVTGDLSGWGLVGAWLWLVCRIVYIPLYLAGIAYVRSLVWCGSLAGLLVMAAVLIF
ncbi:MAPEG family protein [Rhizobium herbae]|uniref:MAPEG superfamily protein n=1 Tax=Rhizobium herbae TaxID=508661 RepID=A0ABS4EKN4_9HYPH|nr:MAPEG family protein [Rhizobium herbae]MBP1858506.1 putative MAPEG superfamily protein [Rhizobium herbae]